jgi:HK97 family phage portal protein
VSVLRKAFGLEERAFTQPDTYAQGAWGQGMVWHGVSPSGPPTTPEQAMRLTAVFACLRLLSENVATMPIDTFTRREGARYAVARPHYLDFTEPGLSRIDYLSQLMLSLLTDGNAYVGTIRGGDGALVELVVLDPTLVTVTRKDGVVRYQIPDGQYLDPVWDVMHIKGMCLPGRITGVAPIVYVAETAGVGLAAQRFGASFFDNGALPSVWLEQPGPEDREKAKRISETWNAAHRGAGNANKFAVVTGGGQLHAISIAPDQAQFLETRQFTVPDVARIFGVPPHLIADASNSTSWGTGLAEQNTAFGQMSLRPWVERIEEGHDRLLILDGRPDVFLKLNMDGVLRASLRERYESYEIGIKNRVLTSDESRVFEDLPPLPSKIDPIDIEAVGQLIRAGFDPASALAVLGLPPIKHTGTLPVTVQPEEMPAPATNGARQHA